MRKLSQIRRVLLVLYALLFTELHIVFGMTPNPVISRGKKVYTSEGTTTYLNDDRFAGYNPGNNHLITLSGNSWIAINLETVCTNVFFSWSNPNHSWSDVVSGSESCKMKPEIPVDYTLETSSNSTNGSNGIWINLATIKGNIVTQRGHQLNLKGASWIRMSVSKGGGPIDEIEVFDQKNSGTDSWFFVGTSITAYSFKEYADKVSSNYADLIKQKYPRFTPAVIRGGIGCIRSSAFKNDIQKYIANAGNVKYWAIEMGTNDATLSGNANVASFKNNLQAVITACKNAGIQPIIARTIATNPAKAAQHWQVHADYPKAIDELTASNKLIAGPDLYNYFLAHPGELRGDGVHPTTAGAASIHRLWAEKMAALYTVVTSVEEEEGLSSMEVNCFPNPFTQNFQIKSNGAFNYSIYDMTGNLVDKGQGEDSHEVGNRLKTGIYLVKISTTSSEKFTKIIKN